MTIGDDILLIDQEICQEKDTGENAKSIFQFTCRRKRDMICAPTEQRGDQVISGKDIINIIPLIAIEPGEQIGNRHRTEH